MTLGELIKRLRAADPALVVRWGFGRPASYRGDYSEVAFAPAENVTVASMLAHAESALGATFQGWTGGDFKMHEYINCHISETGTCGNADEIGETLLAYMLGQPRRSQWDAT